MFRSLLFTVVVTAVACFGQPLLATQAIGQKSAGSFVRVIQQDGYHIELDLGHQILRFNVPPDIGHGRGVAKAAISPTLAQMPGHGFASAAILAQKAKQFDDGLYAAIDLAAERGAGRFSGKAKLLQSLIQELTKQPGPPTQSVSVMLAATQLGLPNLPLPFQSSVQATLDNFHRNKLLSKPIGFYTWSDELRTIFQQDRMLQTELKDQAGIESLVRALHADAEARETYENYLTLVSRLTNPLVKPDLRPQLKDLDRGHLQIPSTGVCFFPPSLSHETELVKRLFENRPIPDGFSLVDEMIQQIRSGHLSLAPTRGSGWYDYQTWALEPLVIPEKMPESKHLQYDPSYSKQLLELFKGILALTRETHIKQLEIPSPGAAAHRPSKTIKIFVRPELSAEPLASYYFRRTLSYTFIRLVLENTFGREALQTMHRQTAAGPVQPSLAEELQLMENLFYGAHATICRQIGMAPLSSPQIRAKRRPAEAAFAAWIRQLESDSDVGQDARMMVPLFYDIQRKKTKVWVVMGWSSRRVSVDFAQVPTAKVLDASGKPAPAGSVELNFGGASYDVAYPVSAEVYVTKILNREEFRRICDEYQTAAAILEHLQ
ncbi:MAG: hypothetical protein WCJ35_16980 [Planctomycetota bacterium]